MEGGVVGLLMAAASTVGMRPAWRQLSSHKLFRLEVLQQGFQRCFI